MHDRFENLTKYLDSFLGMGVPGYDTAVYHKGECVYRRSNGKQPIATRSEIL